MAQTHNTFFRALNAIYQQCTEILPGSQDAVDMLTYCSFVYEFIHQHQLHEEAIFFPEIERATGNKGLMELNLTQHQHMDAGLEKFRNYAEKTHKDTYSGAELRKIIDAFAKEFESHNHAEIATILNLHDKIDSTILKDIDERMRNASEKDSDMFKAGPLVLGCQDKSFIIDDDIRPYPEVPFMVKMIVDLVLSRRHKDIWRFNPSNMYGRPRRFPPVVTEKASTISSNKKKGVKIQVSKSKVFLSGFGRFVPIFAALVSVWSLLTLLSV